MNIKVVNKSEFELPKYETGGSAGLDLRADLNRYPFDDMPAKHDQLVLGHSKADGLALVPNKIYIIPTGLFISIPNPDNDEWGYEAQIRPRSGLSAKHGITLLNSPGTIDMDYRGEIKIILMNLSNTPYVIKHGDRIAQMLISKYYKIKWQSVIDLDDTSRGEGGFGSTGKN